MLRRFCRNMSYSSKDFLPRFATRVASKKRSTNYQDAIEALNDLQSNAEYLAQVSKVKLLSAEQGLKNILETRKYLIRSGITFEQLDTLSVIHVAGTKGKGTTCALCESILRHHGLRTGFFSSPHLLEVRERIRINGIPLKKDVFAKYFWEIYNKLDNEKTDPCDMPMYFKFLTLLAFKVFLAEKVDVAVVEVGIGGEYDSTNILRKVPVVGITSLGIDHTNILGDTLESIAWHKAGIMKPGSQAFTIAQPISAIKVLEDRSIEKKCLLKVVECLPNLPILPRNEPADIFKLNASLALTLTKTWMNLNNEKVHNSTSEKIVSGILNCTWPGRYQIIRSFNTFYLDGAHTLESIKVCAEWFSNVAKNYQSKVLIFNATGDRNSEELLRQLSACCFQKVYFVPNIATFYDKTDVKNYTHPEDQQLKRCHLHYETWLKLQKEMSLMTASVKVLPSVSHALQECQTNNHHILVTGSLHLVGAVLSIVDSKEDGLI